MEIGYLSECDTEYANKLAEIKTHGDLVNLLNEYAPIAHDALKVAKSLDEKGFKKLMKSMAKERKGIYSKDKLAAIVMMPETMFRISVIANKFGTPWGCAFIRMKQEGFVEENNGFFSVKPR